ncbi:hypothetical protein BSU04_36255 [Caballeronia sordidicola]|jgi:hypothetical protein|uniref:Transcriptional regulator, LysR family n=1 Tax=Caballeronia sordidicola TaxID=196367 RepID=A0A226WSR5_CABSO|nr:hypothetical protein BSU04_36255 [Caballeronia sordidicola]
MIASAVILVPFPRRSSWRFADQVDLLPLPVEVRCFELSAAWHPRLRADPAHAWLHQQLFAVAKHRTAVPERTIRSRRTA